MRGYTIIGLSILLHGGAVIAQPAEPDGDLEAQIIQTGKYDPTLGWDRGTMSVDFFDGAGRNRLQFSFAGVAGKRLASATITTIHWSLDISPYVRDMVSPIPSRVVVTWDSSGKSDTQRMSLGIPFWKESVGEPEGCKALWIKIENGKVVAHDTVDNDFENCAP